MCILTRPVRCIREYMNFFFDKIPLVVLIVGICMLMLYPYIGAGLMLAALCFRAERYGLMAACFVICILLQSIMGKRILTHHVDVGPSRASQKKEEKGKPKKRRKKKKKVLDEPEGHEVPVVSADINEVMPEEANVPETMEVPGEDVHEVQEITDVPDAEVVEVQEVSEVPVAEGNLVNEVPEVTDEIVPDEKSVSAATEIPAAGAQDIKEEVTDLPVAGVGVE